jgi:hypothetical protein
VPAGWDRGDRGVARSRLGDACIEVVPERDSVVANVHRDYLGSARAIWPGVVDMQGQCARATGVAGGIRGCPLENQRAYLLQSISFLVVTT